MRVGPISSFHFEMCLGVARRPGLRYRHAHAMSTEHEEAEDPLFPPRFLPCYHISMSVFKTYDIRGIWGQGIDDVFAYRLGRALVRHMKAKTWLLGHDARLRSPELYAAIASGLIDEGAKVTGIGLASTPLLHYTQMDEGLDAAVMVTASHNPKEYHGFKVFDTRRSASSSSSGYFISQCDSRRSRSRCGPPPS